MNFNTFAIIMSIKNTFVCLLIMDNRLDWIGLDWIGLDNGLDNGLDIGLDIGLDWIGYILY